MSLTLAFHPSLSTDREYSQLYPIWQVNYMYMKLSGSIDPPYLHQANWQLSVRTRLLTCFDHLAKSVSYKHLQFKAFCLCVICSYPPAEYYKTTTAVLKHLWVRVFWEVGVTREFKVPDDDPRFRHRICSIIWFVVVSLSVPLWCHSDA